MSEKFKNNQQTVESFRTPGYADGVDSIASSVEQLYNNYDIFKGDVDPLIEQFKVHGLDHQAGREDFVANGAQSAVFLLDKAGKEYVVKVPCNSGYRHPESTQNDTEAGVRAWALPHYEQVVATSREGVIISEYVPGVDMFSVTEADLQQITGSQIDTYVETIIAGHARGIGIDPKPGNVIYDANEGFTIIDFTTQARATEEYITSPAVALAWGAEALTDAGLGDPDKHIRPSLDLESDLAKIKVPLLEAYMLAVQHYLDGQDHDKALPFIQKELDRLRHVADKEAHKNERKQQEQDEAERKASLRRYDPVVHGVVDDIF